MELGLVRVFQKENVARPKFCRELEAFNMPSTLAGGIEHWPAIKLWDPKRDGLSHLKTLAGSAVVQAMTSDSGSAFYGFVKGHQRMAVSFGSFIDAISSGADTEIYDHSSSGKNSKDYEFKCSPSYVEKVEKVDTFVGSKTEHHSTARRIDLQFYLAQVPIFSSAGDGRNSLASLMQDIRMPMFLNKDKVSDINFWMSMGDARSSVHYDPDHNLLCCVAGLKKVTLWPPSAAPYLYPLPINGEASNHSGVDFVQPNYKVHPLFEEALPLAKHVTLHPGDCLFIPEGWWHQVDNTGITIAVNFWWPSKLSLNFGSHMDAYFLRRVVASLVDHEKDYMLRNEKVKWIQQRSQRETDEDTTGDTTSSKDGSVRQSEGIPGYRTKYESMLTADAQVTAEPLCSTNSVDAKEGEDCTETEVLEAAAKRKKPFVAKVMESEFDLCERYLQYQATGLSSFRGQVHEHPPTEVAAESPQKIQSRTSLTLEDLNALETCTLDLVMNSLGVRGTDLPHHEASAYVNDGKRGYGNNMRRDSLSEKWEPQSLEEIPLSPHEDQIAGVFLSSTAKSLQRILLVMANQFPRSLQSLILTSLSPCAAEILTRKFEEMDAVEDSISQSDFYQRFYSAFDDSNAVMDALVDGKEAFAAQALRNVMLQYLGLSCCLRGDSFQR